MDVSKRGSAFLLDFGGKSRREEKPSKTGDITEGGVSSF